MSSWNDGPGATPLRRARLGFRLKVVAEGEHWRWTGLTNFRGSPVMRMPSGVVVDARLVAWDLFRGRRLQTLEHVCELDDCVRPESSHNRRPIPAAKGMAA